MTHPSQDKRTTGASGQWIRNGQTPPKSELRHSKKRSFTSCRSGTFGTPKGEDEPGQTQNRSLCNGSETAQHQQDSSQGVAKSSTDSVQKQQLRNRYGKVKQSETMANPSRIQAQAEANSCARVHRLGEDTVLSLALAGTSQCFALPLRLPLRQRQRGRRIAVLQVVLLNRLSWFDHVTYEHIDWISFSSWCICRTCCCCSF